MKFYVLLLVVGCTADQIQLSQDSVRKGLKAWTSATTSCSPGWVKATKSNVGIIWETCVVTTNYHRDNNCYLYSPYWLIGYSDVNVVFINVYGGGSNCTRHIYHCTPKLDFKVYTGSDGGAVSKEMYNNVSLLPSHLKPDSDRRFYTYNETFEVSVLGDTALKLMFHTTHFCGQIYGASMYYYTCPSVSKELIKFPEKKAPGRQNSPSKILGVCVDKSVQITTELYMNCYYNGTATVHGKCGCKKGFEVQGDYCQECDGDKFKANIGNEKCKSCGKSSQSQGRTSCTCKDRYFREVGKEDDNEADCYRPPNAPTIKVVRNITENSAIVEFNELEGDEIGDGSIGKYILNCSKNCPHNNNFPMISKTSFNVTGLGSYVTYHFTISNRNDITKLTGHLNQNTFNFTTRAGGTPGKITDFKVIWNSDGSVTLTWKGPTVRGGQKLEYVVTYGDKTRVLTSTNITIESSSSTNKYTVQIYAQYRDGQKLVTGEMFTSEEITVKGGIPLLTTVIVVVAIILVIILIAITSFCIYRRRNPPLRERREDGTVIQPSRFIPGSKVYVDPTLYKDVDDAVEQFANELNRSQLTFGGLIGGGEFAEVYTGTLAKTSGKLTNVAIKTLKPGANKKDRDDFFSEAAILGQFGDPNVIAIEGVVMKDRPYLIILEYMANGSLDTYLQKNDMQFQVIELLGMSRCVASGMAYLSDMGFIHRDLAARNVLVDEHNICKVTDFGMSRELKLDDTYETQGGKIPVRWTAPEAIQYKKFTSASDCWSYGILLWEVMSYGERPYWDWNNYTVLERLNDGYRLPPPMNCRKVIHNLMLECWNKERAKRPKFKEIREKIEQWIRSPELLAEIASVVTKTDENLDYTVLETVQLWLEAIGMEQYTEMFLNNQLSTPKQLLDIGDNDLIRIGINPIGHRKKILKAIKNTNDQVETRHRGMSMNGTMRKKTFSLTRSKK